MTLIESLEAMSPRACARDKIYECKRALAQAERLGAVDPGTYSWQDVFAGTTGVCIESEDAIDSMNINDLSRIIRGTPTHDFFAERVLPMPRSRMLDFAERLIAGYNDTRRQLIAEGVFDETVFTEYPWQDELYENTGIDIEDISDLQNLSDEELYKIVDMYI